MFDKTSTQIFSTRYLGVAGKIHLFDILLHTLSKFEENQKQEHDIEPDTNSLKQKQNNEVNLIIRLLYLSELAKC